MGEGCPWVLGTGSCVWWKVVADAGHLQGGADSETTEGACQVRPSQGQLPKRLESRPRSPLPPHPPILRLSLNCSLNMPRSSRPLGLVKSSFVQCPWKGRAHNGNIMFQWDGHSQRFACPAAIIVLQFCGASPPPPHPAASLTGPMGGVGL